MDSHKGWFSIVQYCPDPNRLEAANLGVLLFCPALSFLDVKVSADNHRIRKFFGDAHIEFGLIQSFKKGLGERLAKEKERITTYENLVDFADRRANQLQISAPRSIRIIDPRIQLKQLFEEMVGGEHPRRVAVKRLLAKSLERPALQTKLYRSISVDVPIIRKKLEAPYAFQNGRFNLIQPVRFQSDDPVPTASRYAVQGDSIFETPHQMYGDMKLLVVGSFRGKADPNQELVRRLFKKHHVELFTMDNVNQLTEVILKTGKDKAS